MISPAYQPASRPADFFPTGGCLKSGNLGIATTRGLLIPQSLVRPGADDKKEARSPHYGRYGARPLQNLRAGEQLQRLETLAEHAFGLDLHPVAEHG